MATIEFLYDFGSPNAYLVHKVLPALADANGASVAYRPILLGGVFKATNNQTPFGAFADVTGKIAYIQTEFARFVERHQVPFKWNTHFPVNTLALMRAAMFAQGKEWEAQFIEATFDAMWVNSQDMSKPEVIAQTLQDAGLPSDDIASAIQLPDIKGRLAEATEAAVTRGVFGAPTMFLGDEMFYGKDALPDLEWRLGQSG